MVFVPGHEKIGGRKKGTLNRETLTKLERRSIFDKEVSQMWEDTIKKMRPEYIGDQFIGKAPDKMEITGELITKSSFTAEEIAILKANVKKRQLNDKR